MRKSFYCHRPKVEAPMMVPAYLITMAAAVEVEWRAVDGTNLEVSDDGRVRRNGVEFVPWIDGAGYYTVDVARKKILLHRMIAAAFIPNPLGKPCVDHINRRPLDNRVCNLRWATQQENMMNARNGARRKCDLPRGVVQQKSGYVGRFQYMNELITSEVFDNPDEASAWYETQKMFHSGEFYVGPDESDDESEYETDSDDDYDDNPYSEPESD